MNKLPLYICCFLLTSCNKLCNEEADNEENIGKYRTEYAIYWNSSFRDINVVYTNNEVYTCSFQGTNFLLEKDNPEEIYSSTAPIKIISCEKIENDEDK